MHSAPHSACVSTHYAEAHDLHHPVTLFQSDHLIPPYRLVPRCPKVADLPDEVFRNISQGWYDQIKVRPRAGRAGQWLLPRNQTTHPILRA